MRTFYFFEEDRLLESLGGATAHEYAHHQLALATK